MVPLVGEPGVGDTAFDSVPCVVADGRAGICGKAGDLAPYSCVAYLMSSS